MKVTGNANDIANMLTPEANHSCWKSLESYTRYIKSLDKNKAWCSSGWDEGNEDFYGTKTMEEALKLADNGWKEGVERVDKLVKMIYALNPVLKVPAKYGIAGSVPNIPRAVAGNPMNMRVMDTVASRRRPALTLVFNMAEHCLVDEARLTNKAATMAAVIDQIEARGFSCEVIAQAASRGYGKPKGMSQPKYTRVISVRLKEPNQPVDIPRMAFGLGHSSFFRRFTFAEKGYDEMDREGLGSGLGYPYCPLPSQELADKNVYIIPSRDGVDRYFKNEDVSATLGLKWIMEQLAQQGCPAVSKEKFNYTKKHLINEVDDDEDDD